MEQTFRGEDKVRALMERGAAIPNPLTLDVDDDVDLSRIAADVTIHPGCRIHGALTSIGPGSVLGAEGPVTIEDCQLGSKVELKAGSFSKATFLDGANMGPGAHVREGCLLEEEAGGAHSVGLKQTILLPFVTLGSLINFCDCLMAGGTSRSDHSEVGSSYIHFNYTPDQDKTTASLFGDAPRGVMLDQPPIFLGGQGGAVGPVVVGFGTIVAAGSILRRDVPEDGKLVVDAMPRSMKKDFVKFSYPNLARIIGHNARYVGNLVALEQWYRHARKPFLTAAPLGEPLYEGATDKLKRARAERVKRLGKLADKTAGAADPVGESALDELKRRFGASKDGFLDELRGATGDGVGERDRDAACAALEAKREGGLGYIEAVRSLDPAAKSAGTAWLAAVVDAVIDAALGAVPRPATNK